MMPPHPHDHHTAVAPALIVFLTQLAAAGVARGEGSASCPCITSFAGFYTHTSTVAGTIDVKLGAATYRYPAEYGVTNCTSHDKGLAPYCNVADSPEWCAAKWCYVDPKTCNYPAPLSSYFKGMRYSYKTCGASNTFDSWFGANAAASGAHALTDIADVVEGYLHSITNVMESNYLEIANTPSVTCTLPEACSCKECKKNDIWKQAIDVQTATFWQRPSSSSSADVLRMDKCLASFISDSFTHVAAKEANTSNIGYAYSGSQANGNYVQWPGTDWCPSSWDPRFRPWYATAASGPKDVVIVLDTSGSMSGQPEKMARDAAKAVLKTLTDADFVTLIGFSGSAYSYSSLLQRATDSTLSDMNDWIETNIGANGGTNFRQAFQRVWQIFASTDATTGHSTNCKRVVLFLSDGKPSEWSEDDYKIQADLAKANGNVHILTYGLGSGVDTSILKRLACENLGVAYLVPQPAQLANTMAAYYKVLAPMQSPCQTRWIEYTDVISGTRLLGACLAAYVPQNSSGITSCQGGLSGLGDNGDSRIPDLIGVSCIDLNMLVKLEVIKARPDWSSFEARLRKERTACPRVTLNKAQMQTIRRTAVNPPMVCPGDSDANDAINGVPNEPPPSAHQRPVQTIEEDELGIGVLIAIIAIVSSVVVVVTLLVVKLFCGRPAPVPKREQAPVALAVPVNASAPPAFAPGIGP